MEKKNSLATFMKEYAKIVKENIDNITPEKTFIACQLLELRDVLILIEKNKADGNSFDLEKYERMLANYEGLIDRKYWNDNALSFIVFALSSGVMDSLDATIALYEKYKLRLQ